MERKLDRARARSMHMENSSKRGVVSGFLCSVGNRYHSEEYILEG